MKKFLWGFWSLLVLVILVVGGCGKSESVDDDFVTNPALTNSSNTPSQIEAFTLSSTANTVVAAPGDVNKIYLIATLKDEQGNGVQNRTVNFTASQGKLGSTSVKTDASGVAKVFLFSTERPAVSYVTATDATSLAFSEKFISFTPGPAAVAKSSIVAAPSTIPADGTTTSTITVTLLDANSTPVADGTPVTLIAPAGTLTKPTATTTSGRAVFTITSATTPQTVTLSTNNLSGLTGSLVMGSGTVGEPANITLSASATHIFVAGVGKTENTNISVSVLDAAGNSINDYNLTANNLKITWISHPWGGEYLTGIDLDGTTINRIDDASTTMFVKTVGGEAILNLQSGHLPGSIEVEVEALDAGGASFDPPVKARLPQIVIASGPPHTIVITHPITNAIVNSGSGVYQMKGSAIVTDRFGNAVPDGTAIHFGLIDSVIAHGFDGATTAANSGLTSATNFSTASIVRNALARNIQTNDRVLISNTGISDRSHYVESARNGTLTTTKLYQETRTSLEYWVGASLLGAHINGCRVWSDGPVSNLHDDCEEYGTGVGFTKLGLVPFWMVYPANLQTIMTGSKPAFDDPALDTRITPLGSAKVILVTSSSDNSTTSLDMRYYFAPVSPFTIEAVPDQISSSQDIVLTVRDGGDTIPVPFIPVTWTFVPPTGAAAGEIDVDVTLPSPLTNLNGQIVATVVISGTGFSEPGTLTFYAEKGKVEVKVYHP
ncbi:MAG: hypothetical protein CVU69_07935 [Deltaproteobacteria bacterium HGW-Deltaproteobacteria-4]|nr:MAG: hypothetical protein CVU69_07935 [Deltaproteobacteria bacterium HGW-Deltaproteobacteria-4]